jgi:hypothetical protein
MVVVMVCKSVATKVVVKRLSVPEALVLNVVVLVKISVVTNVTVTILHDEDASRAPSAKSVCFSQELEVAYVAGAV